MALGSEGSPGRPQRISENAGVPGGRALPLPAFSFFSFDRVAPAALSFSERPLFWMQDRWPGLGCIFVKKFSERWSTRETSGHDVAGKRLGFHDRDIRLTGNGKKIVRRTALDQAGCPEVIRHGDLVQRLSV